MRRDRYLIQEIPYLRAKHPLRRFRIDRGVYGWSHTIQVRTGFGFWKCWRDLPSKWGVTSA